MLRTAIVGWPQVGKTALFRLLTGSALETEGAKSKSTCHLGVAEVPDPRLDKLAEIFKPRKITPAQIEFADLAGIRKGESKDSTYLAQLRNVDALAHVIRAFEDPSVLHIEGDINPRRDHELFEMEMMLADLALLESRLERVQRDMKKARTAELQREAELLERLIPWLEQGRPLREFPLEESEERIVRGFTLLSLKPLLLVLNLDEKDVRRQESMAEALGLKAFLQRPRTALVTVCARVEQEISELPEDEAAAFLGDLGYAEPGLHRLVTRMYELLDLTSFLTAGEQEVRAWPIPRHCTALKAAGTIHSDFERGFIRAEVVPWQQLLAAKGYPGAREKAWLRQEGKDYRVQDGDVIVFRFNV